MIFGIGNDIIEVERIKILLDKDDSFVRKVYTESEIEYCRSKKNASESFAARFAAKEAMFKAMGTGWRGEMTFRDIEVSNDSLGKPEVVVSGAVKAFVLEKHISHIHISLSHVKQMAIATIILEKED